MTSLPVWFVDRWIEVVFRIVDEHRWGFEEADDEDYNDDRLIEAARDEVDPIVGRDADGVVTITVTPTADIRSVELAADWRKSVDPRGLHASVLAAANTATMAALARQVELAERGPVDQERPMDTGTTTIKPNASPLTRRDVQRLLDAVYEELDQFTDQMSMVVNQVVSVESGGRHVSGSARNGQVLHIAVDASWASTVRNTEIESELFDVLDQLHRDSSPGELANGPKGSAVSELMALASDPQEMVQRIKLAR